MSPDPDNPDAPLDAALFDVWGAAIMRATGLMREVEALYAAPESEAKH